MISELINIFALHTSSVCNRLMIKKEFLQEVALSTGIDEATIRKVFNSISDTMHKKLIKGIDVKLKGFMNLTLEVVNEQKKYNIQKKKTVIVPARFKIKVTLPRKLQERIAQKIVYEGTD